MKEKVPFHENPLWLNVYMYGHILICTGIYVDDILMCILPMKDIDRVLVSYEEQEF